MKRALLMSMFLAACGGGSGVPRDLLLTQLTIEQSTAVCKAGLSTIALDDATLRGYCATKLAQQSDCEGQLEACITQQRAELAKETDPATHCMYTADNPPAAKACAVTVGTYEDCEAAFAQTYADTYAGATCAQPATMAPNPQATPACQEIATKCPQGGMGTGTTGKR